MIQSNRNRLNELQAQIADLQQQKEKDQSTIQVLTRERRSLRDENDQLVSLNNKLQSALHG
ncbi:hypothetical protein BJ944DRAFT_268406 [Cunninghamella echinulata]|nr:hypothetical protein BJ944DRAFT_268406 [Cunninghamella echinulata]